MIWGDDYPSSFLRRARAQLETAETHLEWYRYSECISCCIEAFELFLKCVSLLMTGDYPTKHLDRWDSEEIVAVLTKIPPDLEDELIPWIANFPRLFLLARFWSTFYNIAKYGEKAFKVGADRLFRPDDAKLALQHAKECERVVDKLVKHIEAKKY